MKEDYVICVDGADAREGGLALGAYGGRARQGCGGAVSSGGEAGA